MDRLGGLLGRRFRLREPERNHQDGQRTSASKANFPASSIAAEEFIEFEERWTGAYIFENEWQSFRTRNNRELELTTAPHTYAKPGRYTVAVKVIDIFGNDTMSLTPVSVG